MDISSHKWKESSIQGITLAQAIIERSDNDTGHARLTDPLPQLRGVCAKQSNDRVRTYALSTREVVGNLRRSYIAVNEELKSATRCKERLEKALEHIRKDLILNRESQAIRTYRPPREKEPDCPEELLKSEHLHLLSLKRSLEAHLRKVKFQLHELNSTRGCLLAVIQERSRVTDLLCQSMGTDGNGGSCGLGNAGRLRSYSVKSPSSPLLPSGQLRSEGMTTSAMVERHFPAKGAKAIHSKAHSAPVPLEMRKFSKMAGVVERSSSEQDMVSGPYNAFSCEAMRCMEEAANVILTSKTIRQAAVVAMSQAHHLQEVAHNTVNEGLTRKLAQTITLSRYLNVSGGETRIALQRCQRQNKSQTKALGYLLGPVSSEDLSIGERLDRPSVDVYQRHVGTDLPEASHLVRASQHYNSSTDATLRNMSLLTLAKKSLRKDNSDKKAAADLDFNVIRLRRRKANHRWIIQGKSCHFQPQ